MSVFSGKTLMITGGTGSFGNAVLNRFLQTDIGEIPTDGNYENVVLIGAEAPYNFYDPKSNRWSDEPLVDVMEDKLEAVVRYTGDGKKKEPSYKVRCAALLTSDWSITPAPGWNVFFDLNWLEELENDPALQQLKED